MLRKFTFCKEFLNFLKFCKTGIRILKFWWYLPFISKPGSIRLNVCFITCAWWVPQIHLKYDRYQSLLTYCAVVCCRQALKPTELLLYSNISISEYPLNAKMFSKLSRSRENKRITCNESLFNACMHHHLSESVCFRFDTKSHGCLWDRLHHNLYMPVAMELRKC